MSVNTASVIWPVRASKSLFDRRKQHTYRPSPIRVRTFSQSSSTADAKPDGQRATFRARHKSVPADEPFSPRKSSRSSTVDERQSPRISGDLNAGQVPDVLITTSPPTSPSTVNTETSSKRSSLDLEPPEITPYDFSRVDYELEKAKVLGQGLWSTVYLAEHKPPKAKHSSGSHRPRNASVPSLFAVKAPSRQDSTQVFSKEAKILSHLQHRVGVSSYVVPFYGQDTRNNSLVFEAVIGGSLEDLASRLKQMTEHARHLEIVNIFPSLASDLISGLEFLHAAGVVHADIKPANVLLDISHHNAITHEDSSAPFIRARYIDFSAAFIPSHVTDPVLASPANAGGTWDYMAPEQLRIRQPELRDPTPASDVWSLGITLLAVLIGASPYAAAVAPGNTFMLREAVKAGDPLGFARADPVAHKRLAACQDFVDCLRLALKKDREIRISTNAWQRWVSERDLSP